jgi:hypothetical protein
MILFHQGAAERLAGTLGAQCEVAQNTGAVDAATENQDIQIRAI